MSFGGYVSAYDFFAAAREAVGEQGILLRQLISLEETEGAKAQSYGAATSHGGNQDVMQRVDRRIDMETELSKRLDDNRALIIDATSVIYGRHSDGGIDKLLGHKHAAVMEWYYIGHLSYRGVSKTVKAPVITCRRMIDTALDLCDVVGFGAMVDGIGFAE